MKRKRLLLVAGGLLTAFVAAALIFAGRGTFRVYDHTTSVCSSRAPRSDRTLLARCVELRGTLLHVRRAVNPRNGAPDVHVLVSASFRLYIVKMHMSLPHDLSVGDTVTAIGALVQPHPSHFGIDEVDAALFHGS